MQRRIISLVILSVMLPVLGYAQGTMTPSQWQLTLDVIKNKAQGLVVKNNELAAAYDQLVAQEQQAQAVVQDKQAKVEAVRRLIEARHGKTDQQVRIEELTTLIKNKKVQLAAQQQVLASLKKQEKTSSSTTRWASWGKGSTPRPQEMGINPDEDSQLAELRYKIEAEKKQEVALEKELEILKSSTQGTTLDINVLGEQNKMLERRLAQLRQQPTASPEGAAPSAADKETRDKYVLLQQRKVELTAEINRYEKQMEKFQDPSSLALTWTAQKKRMIHEMVQADARNNQWRDKINSLREDINILRQQVAKLERRVHFTSGKTR